MDGYTTYIELTFKEVQKIVHQCKREINGLSPVKEESWLDVFRDFVPNLSALYGNGIIEISIKHDRIFIENKPFICDDPGIVFNPNWRLEIWGVFGSPVYQATITYIDREHLKKFLPIVYTKLEYANYAGGHYTHQKPGELERSLVDGCN